MTDLSRSLNNLNKQKVKSYEWISNHPLKLGSDFEIIFRYGRKMEARSEERVNYMSWKLIKGERPDSVRTNQQILQNE